MALATDRYFEMIDGAALLLFAPEEGKGNGIVLTGDVWLSYIGHDDDPDDTDYYHAVSG